MDIFHNLTTPHVSRDPNVSCELLIPITDLVHRYSHCPTPWISQKSASPWITIQYFHSITLKLELCVTATPRWKTPRLSHHRILYAYVHIPKNAWSFENQTFSDYPIMQTRLHNHNNFPDFYETVDLFPPTIFSQNALPHCIFVTSIKNRL